MPENQPKPGATLFVELTEKAALMEWLPKLVGIERSVELPIGEAEGAEVIRCRPDLQHEEQLTREDMTASVHYLGFALNPSQVERFATQPVVLAVNHPDYAEGPPCGRRPRLRSWRISGKPEMGSQPQARRVWTIVPPMQKTVQSPVGEVDTKPGENALKSRI
jgi:hypothetical protein